MEKDQPKMVEASDNNGEQKILSLLPLSSSLYNQVSARCAHVGAGASAAIIAWVGPAPNQRAGRMLSRKRKSGTVRINEKEIGWRPTSRTNYIDKTA